MKIKQVLTWSSCVIIGIQMSCQEQGNRLLIFGGMPASKHVVFSHFQLQLNTPDFKSICTGILIDEGSDSWFLSAKHCVEEKYQEIDPLFTPHSALYQVDQNTEFEGHFFDEIGYREDVCSIEYFYTGNSNFRKLKANDLKDEEELLYYQISHDIMLGRFAENCSILKNRKKIALAHYPVDYITQKEGLLIQTGYGRTSDDPITTEKRKNLFFTINKIDTLFSKRVYAIKTKKQLFQNTCHGDSGGGLIFIPRGDPKDMMMILIGILYGGEGGCNEQGGQSTYIEIYPHLKWIREVLQKHEHH